MESSTSDTPSWCPMDILTDDALIIIFSFLRLYERITLMRVNKSWKRILSNPQTWTHLDFWQEQKINKYWETGTNTTYWNYVLKLDSWLFPREEKAVLDFLRKYTCASLKSLYLHVVSEEIMMYLKESCRHLETISFLSAHRPPYSAFNLRTKVVSLWLPKPCSHSLEYVVQWLPNITVCELPLDAISCITCIEKQQKKLLICLQECQNLRRVTLYGLEPRYLTPDSFDGISQEIIEVNIITRPVKGSSYNPFARPRIHRPFDYSDQLCTSFQALIKLANMNTFRISTTVNNNDMTFDKYNIDEFLCGIADRWHELKCLSLSGIESPSEEMFSLILARLSQLEQLELYNGLATNYNISLIAEHLKKLIALYLTDGTYTTPGIKSLCGHPSIEKINLIERAPERTPNRYWLMAVCDVIRSLPKITSVRLVGHRLTDLQARESILSISPNIQIDIQDIKEVTVA